jgi:hypothetical protein
MQDWYLQRTLNRLDPEAPDGQKARSIEHAFWSYRDALGRVEGW